MVLNILVSALLKLLFFISLCGSEKTIQVSDRLIPNIALHRSRRQLLFPNSTVLQFNAGIGTPTPADMVNLNWAFQANFQLPWNRTQIPIDILDANSGYTGSARKKRDVNEEYFVAERDGDYESDARLFHFYKFVEDVLNNFGYNGTACVLQTLCQLGAEPLHAHYEEDLLHELATFVLNPTNDAIHEISEKDEPYPYIEAYTLGQKIQNCNQLYKKCTLSLLDMFTKLHDVDVP